MQAPVDPYALPSSPDVLRNRLDLHDRAALASAEYFHAANRAQELESGRVLLSQTGDLAQLQAIHHHVFQDVYDWAGELRTCALRHPDNPVFFASPEEISRVVAHATNLILESDWPALGERLYAERIGEVYAWLNYAHPFREGNGRVTRLFVRQMTTSARFMLDYSSIPPAQWNQAAHLSMPDMGSETPVPAAWVELARHYCRDAPSVDAARVFRALRDRER